jgi:hypothetical protein
MVSSEVSCGKRSEQLLAVAPAPASGMPTSLENLSRR